MKGDQPLMHLPTTSGAKPFSHIYIEKSILLHPNTKRILSILKSDHHIIIENYAHLFNRHNQDFMAQKNAQNLILAEKKQDYYYKGSPYCENFGIGAFYYTGMIMNCLYDCSYCYLKSIYPSGHMVIFVNNEDFIDAVEHDLLQATSPIYLAISYDSDLLALNKITHFLEPWMKLAEKYSQLTIEVKTKIGSFPLSKTPPQNVIFAWSLLPSEVIANYERRTPSLKSRLLAIKKALSYHAQVRLSIEPLMPIYNAESIYKNFIRTITTTIDLSQISDINVGGFRISPKQFKTFYKKDPYAPVFAYPFKHTTDGIYYENEATLIHTVVTALKDYVPNEKLIVYEF